MNLTIKNNPAGRGVYATELIPNGTKIIDFTGPYLTKSQTTPQTYAIQIGPDLYIGASGTYDDFVNHSCSPNAMVKITGDKAELIAIRDIQPNEEILFDYSTVMAEEEWEMQCLCGQQNCRRRIRSAQYLPQKVKQDYLQRGILPWYNQP